MDRDAGRVRQLHNPVHGLDGPHLVVGPHHRHQGDGAGVAGQLGRQHLQVHHPVAVHGQPGDLGTFVPFQPFHRVQHRVMLDGGAQDAPPGGSSPDGTRTGP